MFAWKSAALSPAATPLVDMDAPACTSTLPITASSFPCSMSFQGPGSQSFCFVCSASFVSSKACTDPSFLGTQLHAWPHAWHIVAPWSHSERCPAPEEPRQGMMVDPTDPTGANIQSKNKAETTQQPSSLRTPLKSSRIELAGDRMILLPRLSFPQTQNSVS